MKTVRDAKYVCSYNHITSSGYSEGHVDPPTYNISHSNERSTIHISLVNVNITISWQMSGLSGLKLNDYVNYLPKSSSQIC